jgi:hypothetical protein
VGVIRVGNFCVQLESSERVCAQMADEIAANRRASDEATKSFDTLFARSTTLGDELAAAKNTITHLKDIVCSDICA